MTTTTKLSELTGDYVLDTAHTRIGFVARHTMATKAPGQFGEFEGSATINRKDWGVHGTPPPGVVSKKVTLEFDVAAIRRS
jgi:polyisoprenoid-binding protein YceI